MYFEESPHNPETAPRVFFESADDIMAANRLLAMDATALVHSLPAPATVTQYPHEAPGAAGRLIVDKLTNEHGADQDGLDAAWNRHIEVFYDIVSDPC
jgi:hypothetical protein